MSLRIPDAIRREPLYVPFVEAVLAPLRDGREDLDWEELTPEGVVVFRLRYGEVEFDFVFWVDDEPRFSFFIQREEIADENLESREQACDTAEWVRTMFSHPIAWKSRRDALVPALLPPPNRVP